MKAFEKVVGYEDVKAELMQICDSLKNSEKYKKLGISVPKGLMLYGKPGLGKTLMANVLIEASGCRYFVCKKDKPNGEFVKYIKEIFDKAVEAAPSIVLLDDMDKFANEDERHPNAEEYVTVQSCIDAAKSKDVFVIATVNHIDNLPKSLKRAGRFDICIHLKTPKGDDALLITRHYLNKIDFQMDLDVNAVGKMMSGHSCAELECIINRAGLLACYENAEKITMKHFMRAYMKQINDVDVCSIDTLCNGSCVDLNNGRNRVAQTIYHEAGHLVAAEVLSNDSVKYACIYSECGRIAGMTSVDIKDNDILEEWLVQVVIGLAGKATTEQKFGVFDIGCERDVNRAIKIVEDLIKNKAMCGIMFCNGFEHRISEKYSERLEIAVVSEVEKLYLKAKEVIAKNWEFVERIAKAMSEEVLLLGIDIQRIKSECDIVRVCVR
ncbi:MAG: AAA family ATPase [Lachnospiraceae bacterium]|nr:AAA family ATPase [Lachnospiraceae bacterium]